MKLNEAVAKRVIELCQKEELSIYGLSTRTGVPNSTLQDIVKLNFSSTQLKHIYAICDGLKISLTEFFDSPYFNKDTLTD